MFNTFSVLWRLFIMCSLFADKISSPAVQALEQQGFYIQNHYFGNAEMQLLEQELNASRAFDYAANAPANLLQTCPAVQALATHDKLTTLIPGFKPYAYFAVKAFILDKNMEANWTIPWHQDLKIALKKQVQAAGFTNWTTEAGIPHVQPSLPVLQSLVSVRIHLDNCDHTNGAMMLIPATHCMGRLAQEEINTLSGSAARMCARVKSGGIMLFKPLLLHCSPLSQSRHSRRILQIEYAPRNILPAGMQWY